MKEALDKIMTNLGATNSTNKPEKDCPDCKQPINYIQIPHPFKDEMRWVPTACECVIKKQEDWKRQQALQEKEIRIKRALKLSSTMEDIKSMTFTNYQVRAGSESAYKKIVNAVNQFDERGKLGVFIFGETGNGKSHLTAAGGNKLIEKGKAVIFITEKDLLERLKATKNFKNTETFTEIVGACTEADLLIWDDFLSSHKLTDEEKDWIFQILNNRERANKPTWFTTNMTPTEFEDDKTAYILDSKGRTWWRILGNAECVYNRAKNYRKAKVMSRTLGITIEEYEKGV